MYNDPAVPNTQGHLLDSGVPLALIPTAAKTAAYTAVAGDFVPVDATSGTVAITLRPAQLDGSRIAIKKIDSSANTVTIALAGADVFNVSAGVTSATLSLQNQAVVLQYKSPIWYVVSTDVPLSALDLRYVQPSVAATLALATLTAPVINGSVTGTGVASAATASTLAKRDAQANLVSDAFIAGFTATATAAGTTVLTVDSTETQELTGSSTQTVTLPTTGVVKGQKFLILNDSSGGNITVNSSGGSNIVNVQPSWACVVMAKIDTPTSFAHWVALNLFSTNVGFIDKAATANMLVQRTGQGNVNGNAFVPSFTSTATAAGTTAMTNTSTQDQRFTGGTTQTVTLPTTSIVAGMFYEFWNQSSGAITINASGGALVKTLATNSFTRIKAMITTPTVAVDWFAT